MGADEDKSQFRPIGLQTHANHLANDLTVLLFTTILLFDWLKLRKQNFPWWFKLFFVGEILVTVLLTQSRTAYLALFVSSIYFFLMQRNRALNILAFLRKKLRPFILIFIAFAFLLMPMVSSRLLYSLNSFGIGGGFNTRQALEKVAIDLVQKNFWFGVGPGMFIPAAFKESPKGIIQYFPESVHNGFLLFISENGVLAFISMMLFLYFLLKQTQKSFPSFLRITLYSGLLALLIMMTLHPFQNFFSIFFLISWLLVYIQQGNQHEKSK